MLTLNRKKGHACISINAPEEVLILREELEWLSHQASTRIISKKSKRNLKQGNDL